MLLFPIRKSRNHYFFCSVEATACFMNVCFYRCESAVRPRIGVLPSHDSIQLTNNTQLHFHEKTAGQAGTQQGFVIWPLACVFHYSYSGCILYDERKDVKHFPALFETFHYFLIFNKKTFISEGFFVNTNVLFWRINSLYNIVIWVLSF